MWASQIIGPRGSEFCLEVTRRARRHHLAEQGWSERASVRECSETHVHRFVSGRTRGLKQATMGLTRRVSDYGILVLLA
jgi:hypothetical protein